MDAGWWLVYKMQKWCNCSRPQIYVF